MSMIIRNPVVKSVGTILEGVGLIGVEVLASNTLLSLWNQYITLKNTGIVDASVREQYLFAIRNMALNISMVLYSISKYYFFNSNSHKPAAIIAGIPLGTVEELSHAMSHDDLKFRSKGGIFLAYQPGGDQSLRIIGKAIGYNKYAFLIMLDLLFKYGNNRLMDMFANRPSNNTSDYQVFDLTPNVRENLDADPWKLVEEKSLDMGREEFHYTFPVITRDRIYTNMYIETYEFTESIENGLDVISFTLFFRKFNQPMPNKYAAVRPNGTSRQSVLYFYKKDGDDELMNKIKHWDYLLDYGLSAGLILSRVGMMLSHNSPERTIASIFGIAIGSNYFGLDKNLISELTRKFDDIENETDVITYTTGNMEEMMQID